MTRPGAVFKAGALAALTALAAAALTVMPSLAARASSARQTVTIWMLNAASTPAVEQLAKDYTATHPNILVKVISVTNNANDYFTKAATAIAAGAGPDILYMSAADFTQYVQNGVAYPVDRWLKPNLADYYPNVIKSVEVHGHYYAFPKTLQLMGLYYNKSLFAQYHLQPPKTWAQMLADAKKLTTKTRYGLEIETHEGEYQNFEWYPWLWMQGGNILSASGKQVVVNHAAANALQLERSIMQSGVAPHNLATGGFDLTQFGQGKVAMQISGTWGIPFLAHVYPKLKYGLVPYPVPKPGMTSSSDGGGWMWIINARGHNPIAAGDVMNWMTNQSPSRYTQWLKDEDNWPPRKSVLRAMKGFYQTGPNKVVSNKILPVAQMEPEWNAGVVKAVGDAIQAAEFTNEPISQIVSQLRQQLKTAIATHG